MSLNVLVTGAAGRTGRLVLSKLLSKPESFKAKGFVRSTEKAADVTGLDQAVFVEGDITKKETLIEPMGSVDALVLLTSAVPRMYPGSDPPSFYYEEGGAPELVDWFGARNQIDIAKEAGVKHIVMVGSIGSTDDSNPLNRLGNGNILRFKRKAELYLIDSGVEYTVINPSGLLDQPGEERELLFGQKDEFYTLFSPKDISIPRADVARLVIAALEEPSARNKAFDVCARQVGVGSTTTQFADLFKSAPATL